MRNFQPAVFVPAPWLPGPHLQTVYASLLMNVTTPVYRREVLNLPDGDVVAADWLDGQKGFPLLVLVHGMEGDSESRYARLIMNECSRRGWTGVVLHMRSCGGLINNKPNFYHAGFFEDIRYFVDDVLRKSKQGSKIFLAGVSLGGSQLIHYLAKGEAAGVVQAAAAISAPVDLVASADYMNSGLNRLYIYKFTRSLRQKYEAKAHLYADDRYLQAVASARSFWDLDDGATAPLHGFKNGRHYYEEMSAKNCLDKLQVPTLYLAAKDDPFIPADSMPNSEQAFPALTSVLTEKGGHVGFVNASGKSWMTPTLFDYFDMYV